MCALRVNYLSSAEPSTCSLGHSTPPDAAPIRDPKSLERLIFPPPLSTRFGVSFRQRALPSCPHPHVELFSCNTAPRAHRRLHRNFTWLRLGGVQGLSHPLHTRVGFCRSKANPPARGWLLRSSPESGFALGQVLPHPMHNSLGALPAQSQFTRAWMSASERRSVTGHKPVNSAERI